MDLQVLTSVSSKNTSSVLHCSDDPSTWLESVQSVRLARLQQLLMLIGNQGIGFEFTGEQTAYFLLRDGERSSQFLAQTLEALEQNVRTTPFRVSDISEAEEILLIEQLPPRFLGQSTNVASIQSGILLHLGTKNLAFRLMVNKLKFILMKVR